MHARKEGFTKVYNRFHRLEKGVDDIARLRELHVEIDRAVATAYGWTDLALDHDFYETKQGTRFTVSPAARQEILDRLLELNHKRYAEEVAHGLHDKVEKPKAARKKKGGAAKKSSAQGESLADTRGALLADLGDADDE